MSKLLERLITENGTLEFLSRSSNLSKSLRKNGVVPSGDFRRIQSMRRRLLNLDDDELAVAVGDLLHRGAGGTGQNPVPLRPVQAALLVDATEHRSALTSTPVGCGKSFAAALFAIDKVPEGFDPMTWPQLVCERPVLLMPPGPMSEMQHDVLPRLRTAYRLHPNLQLLSYSELQQEHNATILRGATEDEILALCDALLVSDFTARLKRLQKGSVKPWSKEQLHEAATKQLAQKPPEEKARLRASVRGRIDPRVVHGLRPDLIIADEVHSLKHANAARTKRVAQWMKANPATMLVGMTGTLSDASIRDYQPLLCWTHPRCEGAFKGRVGMLGESVGDDSPLPYGWRETEDWSYALDAVVEEDLRLDPGALLQLCEPDEDFREAYQRRLSDTPGVVLVPDASVDVPLTITALRDLQVPPAVQAMMTKLDDTWTMPNGDEVSDATVFAAHMRQLSLGFYYKWVWPNGVRDEEWLDARNEWSRMVRGIIQNYRTGLDSEKRVRAATLAGTLPSAVQSAAAHALATWREQSKKVEPETVPVWVDDFAVNYALAWAQRAPGLVWCEQTAMLERLIQKGLRGFGAGTSPELRAFARSPAAGTVSLALSRASHFEGKNLQAWRHNLVLTPPPSGRTWEQLCGRTHRAGQTKPVHVEFLAHTPISFSSVASAVKKAEYTNKTLKAPQKLLSAIAIGWGRS